MNDTSLANLFKPEQGLPPGLFSIRPEGAYMVGSWQLLPEDEYVSGYRVRGTTESWASIAKRIYVRDGGVCHVCGRGIPRRYYECGHIVDRHVGGPDLDFNLVCMCNVCNRLKPPHDTRLQYRLWVACVRARLGIPLDGPTGVSL